MNIRNLLIHIILILAGAIESAIGLLQIYGLMDSNHGRYVVTGTFLNPGPYSGFLAMTLPVCLHCYLKKQGGMKYVAATVGAMILCVLPAGMSRTAWIAAAMGMLWAYGAHRKWPERVRLWAKQHRLKAMGCVLGVVGALLLGGWMLFILKPDSAKGRLFMWRIESRIVIEHPSGVGCGRFAKAYGEEQEKYFSQGEYEEWEVKVAGSPEYAFNEYLQLAIEHGVGALVALFVVMGLCVWRAMRKGAYGMAGALVALALFAFASYPMEYALFRAAALLIAVGCLAEEGWKGWMITIAGVIGAVYLYWPDKTKEEAEKSWKQARMFYQAEAYETAEEAYKSIYPKLKENGRFLFEYGHALHKQKKFTESTLLLLEAGERSNDPMILNIIGKNYQGLGEYDRAEEYYLRSTHRLPGRIYPYYLLAKLYAENKGFGEEKLEWAVRMVMEREPKVHSTAIKEMREEVKKIISRRKQPTSTH